MGDFTNLQKGPSWKVPESAITITDENQVNLRKPRRKDASIVFQARAAAAKTWFYYPLVAASFGLSVTECVLVGHGTTGRFINAQIAILACSTFFWILLVLYTALHAEVTVKRGFMRNLALVLFSTADLVEIACLAFGWGTIFVTPGASALRCFRVIRQFWHFESFPIPPHELEPNYQPAKHLFSLRLSSRLATQYMERIGVELFSARSRGGAVIIALFFFVTYILAVVYSARKGELLTAQGAVCSDVEGCFYTMLRLAFYDANGFDYMEAVSRNDRLHGYTFLLFFYMIFNGIVLVNGLIAIFGAAFQDKDGDVELHVNRLQSHTSNQNSEMKKLIDSSGQELWTMLSVSIQQGHSLRFEIAELRALLQSKGIVSDSGNGVYSLSTRANLDTAAKMTEYIPGTKYRVWLFDPTEPEVRVVRLTRDQFRFSSMQNMLQADNLDHLPLYIRGDYTDVLCITFDAKPPESSPYNDAAAQFFKYTGLTHRFPNPHGRFIMFHQVRANDEDVLEDMGFSVAEVAALWKSRGAAAPTGYRKPVSSSTADNLDDRAKEMQEITSSGSGFTPNNLEERLKLRLVSLKEAGGQNQRISSRILDSSMSPDISARFEEEGSFIRDNDSDEGNMQSRTTETAVPASPELATDPDVTGRPSVRVLKEMKLVSESAYSTRKLATVPESENSPFDESDIQPAGGGYRPASVEMLKDLKSVTNASILQKEASKKDVSGDLSKKL